MIDPSKREKTEGWSLETPGFLAGDSGVKTPEIPGTRAPETPAPVYFILALLLRKWSAPQVPCPEGGRSMPGDF